MIETDEAECKYCGGVLELARAVQLNPVTEEFEYTCANCALAWERKGKDSKHTHPTEHHWDENHL